MRKLATINRKNYHASNYELDKERRQFSSLNLPESTIILVRSQYNMFLSLFLYAKGSIGVPVCTRQKMVAVCHLVVRLKSWSTFADSTLCSKQTIP